MPNTYNDGGLVFGSQTVLIGAVTFIAEDIDIKDGSRMIETNNETGVPNKTVFIRTKLTGSATLQLPSSSTAAPARFAVVPVVPVGGGTAINFIITEVGSKFTSEGETKVSVSLVEKLN